MKALKTLCSIFLVTLSAIFFSNSVSAIPIPSAEFKYHETSLGMGMWNYDYTLFNTSDPIADAGFDLYDVTLTFNPSASFTLVSLPLGWDYIGGSGFTVSFSTTPGVPPVGYDIAPGSSLSGFSFQFDYQARTLPFDVTFMNPSEPSNPYVSSGTTAPVPEPSTMLLLGAGLAGLVGLRKRFKVKEE